MDHQIRSTRGSKVEGKRGAHCEVPMARSQRRREGDRDARGRNRRWTRRNKMVMRDVMDSRSNVREIEKIERRLGSVQSTIGGDGRGETKSEVLGRVEKTVRGGGGGGW